MILELFQLPMGSLCVAVYIAAGDNDYHVLENQFELVE